MARPATGQVVERRGKRGTTYGLRFRALGRRQYLTLDPARVSTRQDAEAELSYILADVKRGIWRPPTSEVIVETPAEVPTLHVFASEWVAAREHEVDERTVEYWKWALSGHLLPFFASYRVNAIDIAAVERYKTVNVAGREAQLAKISAWEKGNAATRGQMPTRPLSNASVNKTLAVLAQLLDHAIDLGYLDANPARGRKRRLKQTRPRRTWLEANELRALLDAAGTHRPLLATMALAGLRVGEACALRWRDVDLSQGTLRVEDAKTEAGIRRVDLTPTLIEELKQLRLKAPAIGDALVFPTRNGTMRDRHNVRSRVLANAIDAANRTLAERDLAPLPAGITNHSLRRTFCALLYEAGASPAYAMQQMGHTSASLALEVYSKVMERTRDTGARMDALVSGAEWAPMGTNAVSVLPGAEATTG